MDKPLLERPGFGHRDREAIPVDRANTPSWIRDLEGGVTDMAINLLVKVQLQPWKEGLYRQRQGCPNKISRSARRGNTNIFFKKRPNVFRTLGIWLLEKCNHRRPWGKPSFRGNRRNNMANNNWNHPLPILWGRVANRTVKWNKGQGAVYTGVSKNPLVLPCFLLGFQTWQYWMQSLLLRSFQQS